MVTNKNKIFYFYLGCWEVKKSHSENCLPKLEIQDGFSNFSGFYKIVGSISRDYKFNFDFASICTREEPRTEKPIYFTPEAEYGVIREAVSQKLDRSLVNTSNKFWRDSTQTKYPTSTFHIGDSIRY